MEKSKEHLSSLGWGWGSVGDISEGFWEVTASLYITICLFPQLACFNKSLKPLFTVEQPSLFLLRMFFFSYLRVVHHSLLFVRSLTLVTLKQIFFFLPISRYNSNHDLPFMTEFSEIIIHILSVLNLLISGLCPPAPVR